MTGSAEAARVTRLLTDHAPDLLRYFQRRLDYDDAADALAEVIATACRRIRHVPEAPESARMWLFVTARNVAANGVRAYQRDRNLTARLAAATLSAPRIGNSPDSGSEVRDAIERLDKQDAELVRLIHWEGFSIIEAAAILQINASTARGRYQRAKSQLRAALSDEEQPDGAHREEFARTR